MMAFIAGLIGTSIEVFVLLTWGFHPLPAAALVFTVGIAIAGLVQMARE